MSFYTNKRKRDTEIESKRHKALLGEKEREALSNSSEWPTYNHPEGGTVKITPWGSLRQWVDPVTGQSNTRFEDSSFQEMSFEMPHNNNNQMYELPCTPMSLNPSSSSPASPSLDEKFRLSPTNETGSCIRESYDHSKDHGREQAQQFSQEQEHYFGMDEQEDYSDDTAML